MSIKLKSDPQDQTNQEDWKTDQRKEFDKVINYLFENENVSSEITLEEMQCHLLENPNDFFDAKIKMWNQKTQTREIAINRRFVWDGTNYIYEGLKYEGN